MRYINNINFYKNLKHINQSYYIDAWNNCHAVICVAAGATLNDQIKFISDNEENSILICCDTAAPVLFKNHIVPDIITTIDPLRDKYDYLIENAKHMEKTILCYGTETNSDMVAAWGEKKVACFTGCENLNSSRFFSNVFHEHGNYNNCDSVSMLSVQVALKFNPNKVYLVGYDYGYVGEKTHADGTWQADSYKPVTDREIKPGIKSNALLEHYFHQLVSFVGDRKMIFYVVDNRQPTAENINLGRGMVTAIKKRPIRIFKVKDQAHNINNIIRNMLSHLEAIKYYKKITPDFIKYYVNSLIVADDNSLINFFIEDNLINDLKVLEVTGDYDLFIEKFMLVLDMMIKFIEKEF